MIIDDSTKSMKKQTTFLFISLVTLSFALSTSLFLLGYNKFLGIENRTSGDYPTFPYNDLFTQIFIGSLYFLIHIVYIIWLFQPQRSLTNKDFKFYDLIKISSPFLLLAFISYPLGNDIYLYLHYGLMVIKGWNPFILRAGGVSSEFSDFLRWRQTSTYGPVSLLFFVISAAFVPISKLLAIYLFKGICLAAHLLNAYLVFRLLQKSPYLEKVTLAYLCNPLILFEQVGSAHVDVFVCTTFLLLIFCFKYKQYLLGILTLWLGFMAKTLPILWMPLAAAFLIRQRRWTSLVGAVILSLGIVALLTFTVLPTKEAWWSLLNPGVSDTLGPLSDTISSFHRIVATYLNEWTTLTKEFKLDILNKFKLSAYSVFGAFYLATLIQIPLRRRYSEVDLGLDIGWVSWILLVFSTPWLMPWYASILLPATALSFDERRFVLVSLAFCLSSTAFYFLIGTGVIQSWFVVGLPLLVFGLEMIRSRSKRYVV